MNEDIERLSKILEMDKHSVKQTIIRGLDVELHRRELEENYERCKEIYELQQKLQ
jgi:hypothetical protein